ncbi:Fatty acid hydroxylase family (carotene hydroxylase/sterol desaturase) [hydrothermal vent metagenome]|uniref:Fatty acid hydroxylase family (Carotene hydroxylase/sterol desaturase) n=1 Tax=hydrothermal vent metagenome TaxID=652676 RepID=A0A3B0YK86_9ZZZZ
MALFNSPSQVFYWGYLLATLLIAMLVFYVRDREEHQSYLKVFSYCFPSKTYLTRSFIHDIGLFIINIILFTLILTSIILVAENIMPDVSAGLQQQFGLLSNPWSGDIASVVYMLAVMLAVDLGFFISHYLHHKIPVLWEFHKVHHTAEVLNPMTAFRRHPLDYFIELNIIALLLGGVYGVFAWLSDNTLDMVSILGVNAGIFLFLMIGSHLQHSHIWISYGFMNKVLVSPAMHHIHHSSAEQHIDKNMGSMFSFWDWMMGTRYIPQQRESLSLGLAGVQGGSLTSLWAMVFDPFKKLFKK